MSEYVKCVENRNYFQGHEDEQYGDIVVGEIYKAWPYNAEIDLPSMVRIRGEFPNEPGSEEGYLYPTEYFEPFQPDMDGPVTGSITVHLPPDLRRVLRAEALAQGKSVSALLRAWIDERLDLPERTPA